MIGLATALTIGGGLAVSASSPVVTGSLEYRIGALTLAGTALALSDRIAGTVAGQAMDLVLGSRVAGGDHFTTSGTQLVATAPPGDGAYLYTGCVLRTATGASSPPFDLAVTSVPDSYSVGSDIEFAAAVINADPAAAFLEVRGYRLPLPQVTGLLGPAEGRAGDPLGPLSLKAGFAVTGDPTGKFLGIALAPGSDLLPQGLAINPGSGVLSGVPTGAVSAVLLLEATSPGGSAQTGLMLNIAAAAGTGGFSSGFSHGFRRAA
jgi:hypothetical protein